MLLSLSQHNSRTWEYIIKSSGGMHIIHKLGALRAEAIYLLMHGTTHRPLSNGQKLWCGRSGRSETYSTDK